MDSITYIHKNLQKSQIIRFSQSKHILVPRTQITLLESHKPLHASFSVITPSSYPTHTFDIRGGFASI